MRSTWLLACALANPLQPEDRLLHAQQQAALGAQVKTRLHKCTIKVFRDTEDCFLEQTACTPRTRFHSLAVRTPEPPRVCFPREHVRVLSNEIVIRGSAGAYSRRYSYLPVLFHQGVDLLVHPQHATEPSAFDYEACVGAGRARARNKAVVHMLIGLTSLINFVPLYGWLINEGLSSALRAVDKASNCDATLRFNHRNLGESEWREFRKTSHYQQNFGLCIERQLPEIFGVDQVDNVLAKIQNIVVSKVAYFSGATLLPLGIFMVVKDIAASVALSYTQYQHAKIEGYLNCLRYTVVDSLPPLVLNILQVLGEVRETVLDQDALAYLDMRARVEKMHTTLSQLEMALANAEDKQEVRVVDSSPDSGADLSASGVTSLVAAKREEAQQLEQEIREVLGMIDQVVVHAVSFGKKVGLIMENLEELSDARWRYTAHIEEVRGEDLRIFKQRMERINIVRYPLSFVVKSVWRLGRRVVRRVQRKAAQRRLSRDQRLEARAQAQLDDAAELQALADDFLVDPREADELTEADFYALQLEDWDAFLEAAPGGGWVKMVRTLGEVHALPDAKATRASRVVQTEDDDWGSPSEYGFSGAGSPQAEYAAAEKTFGHLEHAKMAQIEDALRAPVAAPGEEPEGYFAGTEARLLAALAADAAEVRRQAEARDDRVAGEVERADHLVAVVEGMVRTLRDNTAFTILPSEQEAHDRLARRSSVSDAGNVDEEEDRDELVEKATALALAGQFLKDSMRLEHEAGLETTAPEEEVTSTRSGSGSEAD